MSGHIYLANNVSIIQKQNSTSNWTEGIKWYKGGQSQAKYNPSIAHHNTGGTSSLGAMTLLPFATDTNPWDQGVGLYLAKNRLKLDSMEIYPMCIQTSNPSRTSCWFNTGTRV